MMTEGGLRELFPGDVVDMVVGVSRMSQVSQFNREALENGQLNTEEIKTMLLAMSDVRVVLIKLADRLHNMRTLQHLPPQKQKTFARETLQVFAPLANRLGVWSVKAELEDLCFKYLHPEQFALLQDQLTNGAHLELLLHSLDQLKGRLDAHEIGYKDLLGRPKNLYGIYDKMQSKNVAIDEIYDVCALRVIVSTEEECYQVLEQVHDLWAAVGTKTKDYIKSPKPNGYQSLHTVAEYGVAAHWQYKEKKGKGKRGTGRRDSDR